MKNGYAIAIFAIGVVVLAYAVLAPRDDRKSTGKDKPVTNFVSDSNLILPSAMKALDEQVQVRDGFIVVTATNDLDAYLMPLQSPWMVRCGVGLSLQLGAVPSGSEAGVSSQVDLSLANDMIEKAACYAVSSKIGARMQEKLAGR